MRQPQNSQPKATRFWWSTLLGHRFLLIASKRISCQRKNRKPHESFEEATNYVLVGDKLYKRAASSGVLLKCVSFEEGKQILDEIHSVAMEITPLQEH